MLIDGMTYAGIKLLGYGARALHGMSGLPLVANALFGFYDRMFSGQAKWSDLICSLAGMVLYGYISVKAIDKLRFTGLHDYCTAIATACKAVTKGTGASAKACLDLVKLMIMKWKGTEEKFSDIPWLAQRILIVSQLPYTHYPGASAELKRRLSSIEVMRVLSRYHH